MANQLKDTKVAFLATDGYEFSELDQPYKKIKEAGAQVIIIAPKSGSIKGWTDGDWGDSYDVDMTIKDALGRVDEFDALVLPGGVMNPDKLRMNNDAVEFTKAFFKAGKPVSAICHGPQLLIECDVLQGREMTSYPSLKTDLKNAGARWVDKEVVCDQALTTSRTPDDLPAFIDKTIEEIREGVHAGQKTA
ncbi:MAG: type 1 glutamine amidotransferase domain-containing protein [Phycisphaerales bacterium]